MESDKLIEAMAHRIAQIEADREGYPLSRTMEEIYEDAWEMATAALKALRDTLEPVIYVVKEEDGPITSYIVSDDKEVPPYAECVPLYALPEVKP